LVFGVLYGSVLLEKLLAIHIIYVLQPLLHSWISFSVAEVAWEIWKWSFSRISVAHEMLEISNQVAQRLITSMLSPCSWN